jgi:hypothetical protein
VHSPKAEILTPGRRIVEDDDSMPISALSYSNVNGKVTVGVKLKSRKK